MLSTKDIYMQACRKNKGLHQMTDEERSMLQAHLRKMYIIIEDICKRHDLQMCVGYGSVLGALRHQGFIPWDDDIDLLMPRKDYDLFINEFENELPENYKIYAPNSKNGPIYRFAKVVDTNTRFILPGTSNDEKHGIFVDIFPLENTPTNKFLVKARRIIALAFMTIASCVQEYKNKNLFYKSLMCSTSKGKRTYLLRKFIGLLFSFLSTEKWFNIFDNFVNYRKDTGFYAVPSGERGLMRYFEPTPTELYFPSKRMKFDDIEVNVPNQAIRHCEIEYGDWKWIPPVEQRWQHFIKELKFNIS